MSRFILSNCLFSLLFTALGPKVASVSYYCIVLYCGKIKTTWDVVHWRIIRATARKLTSKMDAKPGVKSESMDKQTLLAVLQFLKKNNLKVNFTFALR